MQPAFILMKPQLAENVGTALRALWNCGMDDLRLVTPKTSWPSEKGLKAAAGAAKKASSVRTFKTLEEAAADIHLLMATTVRTRDMKKPCYGLPDIPKLLTTLAHPNSQNTSKKMGFLLGPERTGLNSDDVSRAHGILTIDLNPLYGSLNLAQAVLLIAHTCKTALNNQNPADKTSTLSKNMADLATQEDLFGFCNHLERVLEASGFFHPPEMQPKMARNIRNIFTRSTLTDQEIRTLRGIANHFEKILDGIYTVPSKR